MRGISTEMIADLFWLQGPDEVEDDYELSRHELLVALWFEARHGQLRHRKRWRAWVERVEPLLATRATDIAAVELPPTKADRGGE